MIRNDISKILDKYIIDRWRKREDIILCSKAKGLPTENHVLRFNTLSLLAADINSEGAKSTTKYSYLVSEFGRLKEEMKMVDTEITGTHINSQAGPRNQSEEVGIELNKQQATNYFVGRELTNQWSTYGCKNSNRTAGPSSGANQRKAIKQKTNATSKKLQNKQ